MNGPAEELKAYARRDRADDFNSWWMVWEPLFTRQPLFANGYLDHGAW